MTNKQLQEVDLAYTYTIQYNTIQCGYLVPPIHETGPGGITISTKMSVE